MEDFSLIILCRGHRHLLSQTLDTLKPQRGAFEVLLLDGEGSGKLAEQIQHYPELTLRVQDARGTNLAEMMNEGVECAKGKYIQFLEPGDRYISQHGLAFLGTLIKKEPHLVYANCLHCGGVSHFDRGILMTCSPWFLKSKVLEMGGFDRTLVSNPSLDLLCRFFRRKETEAVFCQRVLIDSNTDAAVSTQETGKILYRHFGFWYAFKWIIWQDYLQAFRKTTSFFRDAFWKADI